MNELKNIYGTVVVTMDDVIVNTSPAAYDRLRKITDAFRAKTIEDRGRLTKAEINGRDERELIYWMLRNKHRKEKGLNASMLRSELRGSPNYSSVYGEELYSKLKLSKLGEALISPAFMNKPSVKRVIVMVETMGDEADAKVEFLKRNFSGKKVTVALMRRGDSIGEVLKKAGVNDSWDALVTDDPTQIAGMGFHFRDLSLKRFVVPSYGYNSGRMALSDEILRKYRIRHISYVKND